MNTRLSALRDKMARMERDAFVCTNRANLRYLTGFTGSNGAALITGSTARFITDGRYREQSAQEVADYEITVENDIKILEKVSIWINDLKADRVALSVEGDYLSVNQLGKMRETLAPHVDVCPDSRMVEELRECKSGEEVAATRRAIAVAESAYLKLLPTLKTGDTERGVMRRLRNLMEDEGAEKESFETIVLFGARSSLPHGRPSDAPLARGDWVLIDFGCFVDGYCSDITRTFCFGKATLDMKRAFDLVVEANRRATAAVAVDLPTKIVDSAARTFLETAGHGAHFDHGTGHGIGLEIHEAPRLAKPSQDVLRAGMLVTVEPGIYIPGWGGIRIEDDVLVTPAGPEVLTSLPAEIEPLG